MGSMNNTDRIDRYAARALMMSFFLPMKLQVWVTMATGVYFVVNTLRLRRQGNGRSYLWAFVLGAPYLLYLFAIPFTPHDYMKAVLTFCQQRVSLLFMPFLFAIIMPFYARVFWGELMFFVYGCLITAVGANIAFVYGCITSHLSLGDVSHVAYRTAMHHFADIHPTYMSMYLCWSVCILLLTDVAGRVHLALKNILIFIALVLLLALGAKTPILALLVILVLHAWGHRRSLAQYRMLFVGIVLTVVAAWMFVPFFSQRISELSGFFTHAPARRLADNSVYVREAIWDMDTRLVHRYWLTGVGPGKLFPVLQQHYFFYSLSDPLPVAYLDPHNEYVYEWLSFGISGILVLVAVLLLHFYTALRARDPLYLYLLLIFAFVFFTESALSLQRGVMFFAVFTSAMFLWQKNSD